MLQGLILGALGGVIGMVLGFVGCQFIATIKVAPGRMGSGETMIVSYDYMIYVKAFLLAFLSSAFSSYLPSYAAGKLAPIEIIRSEN
jgi:lipoprotein-releasing system permease protein